MNKKLHYSYLYEKERFWMLSYLALSLAMVCVGVWLLVFNEVKGVLLIVFCIIPFSLFLSEYNLVKEIKKNKYVKEYLKNPGGVV